VPTLKLTKSAIVRIKAPDPSGNQVLYWDTELRGFGVLVSGKTTAKSYIAQKRMPDGRTRRVTVGAIGEFETVEDARTKAGRLLSGLREGRDPKAERRKAAARDRTLGQWLDVYLDTRKDLRKRSAEEYRRIKGHLAAWFDRALREITPEMVETTHAELGESAGPAAANNAMRVLRAVWNFALDRDETLPANPVRRLKRAWFAMPPRTRVVRMEDLAKFYSAVDALQNRTAADYLKFLLFTGLRRREAASLRWSSDIDFTARVIRVPAIRTKPKRKLDLPMSSYVRELLVARRAIGDDGGFVFGADSRSGHIEEPKFAFSMVAEASGIAVSPHDLRRSYITICESVDISPLALKALVNHALGNDVTSGYVQMTAERLREPAQRVCDRMLQLCGIATPKDVEKLA
jgi:integrase